MRDSVIDRIAEGLPEFGIDRADEGRAYNAAKCRECGAVTWVCSIDGGRRPTRAKHAKGCTEPPGRLDLQEQIGDEATERELFGDRLRYFMHDEEVAQAAEAWRSTWKQ